MPYERPKLIVDVFQPRRHDRAQDEAWIRGYLRRAAWGVLAVPSESGSPHLNSNLFVLAEDPDRLYFHTARQGATADALADAGGVPASFTAAAMGRLLPADTALEFSVEYSGVFVSGQARTVQDDDEATAARHLLLDKYAPHLERGRDYRPVVPEELRRTAVFRLDVEGWSGKEKSASDHPGAFDLEGVALPFVL